MVVREKREKKGVTSSLPPSLSLTKPFLITKRFGLVISVAICNGENYLSPTLARSAASLVVKVLVSPGLLNCCGQHLYVHKGKYIGQSKDRSVIDQRERRGRTTSYQPICPLTYIHDQFNNCPYTNISTVLDLNLYAC